MFDKSISVSVYDPNGYIEHASVEIIEKDLYNLVLKYDVSFAKSIVTASFVLKNWDVTKRSSDATFQHALKV